MIKLYDKQECPFCWKVRLALHHCGLEYTTLDISDPGNEAAWKTLTPFGTVPVMQAGDIVIDQSGIMLEFLEDRSHRLLPADEASRVKARTLTYYSDNVIGRGLKEVVFEKRENPEDEWDLERIEGGRRQFEEDLPYLADALGDGPYFAGDYSMADCALAARFGIAGAYGVAVPERHANLRAWLDRVIEGDHGFRESAPPVVVEWLKSR
nr:putative glutathione S-transferase [uncultured bacterium]